MEVRLMKNNRQLSPDRAKVWTEKSPKYQQCRKVPVVYYLCRNRQLEHPHFIEVPLLSADGLYLRDVIKRLNVLRGRAMPSMYSWSCKRSYKSGFVWHDICEDDLILPTNGNEYVLKGSELFEESSNSDCFSPIGNMKSPNPKQIQDLVSSRSREESSSSSSMNGKKEEDDISPPLERPVSTAVSPQYREGKITPSRLPLTLVESKVDKKSVAADASTQTEENQIVSKPIVRETCTRGVSTDDRVVEIEPDEYNEVYKDHSSRSHASTGTIRDSHSPLCSSSASSSAGKTETLESLIRADAGKLNSFRIMEQEEEVPTPTNGKLKATNVLLQLISCGSITVKEHSFGGFIPTYKPRFLHSKFASPFYSTSIMFSELDCLSESSRMMGVRLEDKEYFSGSFIETHNVKDGENLSSLKRSSSYNADRSSKQMDSAGYKEAASAGRSKCIPRTIKASSISRQPRCESMRSPLSDGPRNSSDRHDTLRTTPPSKSNVNSKRYTGPSKRFESNREEDKVIKIEERLASGARVIIQSTPPSDDHHQR